MVLPDRRTTSILLTILLFALALAIVYVARSVIIVFVFSILFAYLINPIIRSSGFCSDILYSSKISEGRTFWKRIWQSSFWPSCVPTLSFQISVGTPASFLRKSQC